MILSRLSDDRARRVTDFPFAADHAAQRTQRRRLAGAIRAEQRRDAAFFKLKIDVMQGMRWDRRRHAIL